MLWVTMATVYLLLRSSIRSSIFRVDMGSRAEVGSSIKSTSGSTASALAMHRRCCCPPDRPRADFFRRSDTSSHSAAPFRLCSTMASSCALFFMPWIRGPYATLSYMLMGNGLGCWNTMPIFFLSNVVSTWES